MTIFSYILIGVVCVLTLVAVGLFITKKVIEKKKENQKVIKND